MDLVARLATHTGVSVEKRHSYDWARIEASLGLRLPDDYKLLVEVFSDSDLEGLPEINRPGEDYLGHYAWRLHDMRELRGHGHEIPYPIFPEPGGLLPWASGPRGEPVFWLTGGEDPNGWPVVTTDAEFAGWREFAVSACGFLIELARITRPLEDPSSRGTAPVLAEGTGATVDESAWLAGLIGPPPVTPEAVNWAEIEEFMGVPLPADYRFFIDTYGPGTFGEIRITVPGGPIDFDLFQLLRRAIEAVRSGERTRVMPICPEPGGIIAWGETADGWTFSWAPHFPDADRWSVVAYSREILVPLWDVSFSQFLRRYAEGDPDIAELLGDKLAPVRFKPVA